MSSPDYSTFRSARYFSCLDGLRCLSIFAVIWHHTGFRFGRLALENHGSLGVDLFFAISGFLITTLLLREREETGTISMRGFYMRRTLRIFPLYYTLLFVYAAVTWAMERHNAVGQAFFANLPYFLSYTSNLFVANEGRVIFYFAWSLATEEQFYLLWPSVERWIGGWRAVGIAAVILAVCAAIEPVTSIQVLVVRVAPPILGGVILAHLLHDHRTFDAVVPLLGRKWMAPAALVALLASIEAGMPVSFSQLLMVVLVGSVVVQEQNALAWFLRWKPVVHMGKISYGMYLMHMLAFNVVKMAAKLLGVNPSWTIFPATALLAAFAASISFRYYESIFLGLKEKWERRSFVPRLGRQES